MTFFNQKHKTKIFKNHLYPNYKKRVLALFKQDSQEKRTMRKTNLKLK